jgi:hypothetical protein
VKTRCRDCTLAPNSAGKHQVTVHEWAGSSVNVTHRVAPLRGGHEWAWPLYVASLTCGLLRLRQQGTAGWAEYETPIDRRYGWSRIQQTTDRRHMCGDLRIPRRFQQITAAPGRP